MRQRLETLLRDLAAVWENPQEDPRRTVVFIGAAVLLLLILVVVALLVVSEGPTRTRRRRLRDLAPARYLVPGVLLMVLGLSLAGEQVVTSNSFCSRCHEIEASVATWKQGSHASASCISCHGGGGLTGRLGTQLRAAVNTWEHVTRKDPRPVDSVSNDRCLGCHEEVQEQVVQGAGVRVRHSDFLEEGARCDDCHGGLGHATKTGIRHPSMDRCLPCHDGEKASAECGLCHVADVAEAREIPESYPKVHLAEKRTCTGCHSLEPCKECHGLEMPHPLDFAEPDQHAPLAAFDKKSLCYRCHAETDCRRCHNQFDGHGPDWKRRHALSARSPDLNCGDCHSGVKQQIMCDLCHPQE